MKTTPPSLFTLASNLFSLAAPPPGAAAPLSADGKYLTDARGGIVILRGVNVSGRAKLPPFLPFASTSADGKPDFSKFDPLREWGMNVIRLLFIWEAYEPEPGQYNQAYLDALAETVDQAWKRGIYVLIDFHHDIFSRYAGIGCGDGFPKWAVPARVRVEPKTGAQCGNLWGLKTSLSPSLHVAFANLYDEKSAVHAAYLETFKRLAARFKGSPALIGYDLINEPWGDEIFEVTELHKAATAAVRSVDPGALVFVTPGVGTIFGQPQSLVDRPPVQGVVYSPHFYDLVGFTHKYWNPLLSAPVTKHAFKTMIDKGAELEAPVFVGEFGAFAATRNVGKFMDLQYDLMDRDFLSGAQWSYTPEWNPADKDGWNQEDLSIVDDHGELRGNFRPRPRAVRIAGEPIAQREVRDWRGRSAGYELSWKPNHAQGSTEIYVPHDSLQSAAFRLDARGPIRCATDAEKLRVICEALPGNEKAAAEVTLSF
jgi:endoglycosylceramidase